MSKEESNKTRYCVQWNAHERYMCTVLCSLMEHQSLVDLAVCCGNSTIHVHKCILAANSVYFREQLEKNTSAEQVVISGLDFPVIKAIIEFIYCGETVVPDEIMKHVISAAKVFQIRGLQALVSEIGEFSGDQVYIPPPVFINKKPKYPSAYRPYNTLTIQPPNNTNKIPPYSYEQFLQKKIKRKYIRSEAERACAKEAAASRQALEALQKELVVQPQVNSFLVEDSCTETTVENFIPHTEEQQYVENVNEFQDVQVINYYRVNDETTADEYANNTRDGQQIANNERSANHLLQFNAQTEVTSSTDDKSVESAGEVTHNVEIMFKTSEGNFVSVTDELLQNISKSALHYQLVDENGYAGEMQELRVLNKTVLDGNDVSHKFIYQQGPSTILNEDLDQNTTVIGEDESMNELVEPIKIKSEETDDDGMIKHEENADYESCLDFLMPDEHTDSVETAENYIPNFSLTPFEDQYEQNNLLDSHHENILENVDQHQHILQNVEGGDGQYQADFEMCVTPKKPKLMKEKHKSHRRQEAKRKFSPRRTRSTVKYHNMPSLSDFENYGEDVRYKTRNRK